MRRTTARSKARSLLTGLTIAAVAASGVGATALTGVALSRDGSPAIRGAGVEPDGGPGRPTAGGAALLPSARARAVPMPKDCGALTTIVADKALRFGIIDGATGEVVDAGLTLDFQPRAATYVVSSTNRGITVRRLLATSSDGGLYLITLQDRLNAATKKPVTTSTVARIGTGWGDVRLLVSSYPYVYGVNDAGALKRYQVTKSWSITSAGIIRKSGWTQVVSLSRGDLWNIGKNARGQTRYGDDIVGVLSTGAVRAYLIPRDTYQSLAAFTLVQKGWGGYAHLSVGSCDSGKARPLVAITKDGQAQAYLDVNGDDQRGGDIRWVGVLGRGWTGLFAD